MTQENLKKHLIVTQFAQTIPLITTESHDWLRAMNPLIQQLHHLDFPRGCHPANHPAEELMAMSQAMVVPKDGHLSRKNMHESSMLGGTLFRDTARSDHVYSSLMTVNMNTYDPFTDDK